MATARRARELFDQYNPSNNLYQPQHLRTSGNNTHWNEEITYDDGTVRIRLYSRETWCMDDFDVFTHEQVCVNNKLVHDERFA